MIKEQGWIVIRIDGKSWHVKDEEKDYDLDSALQAMDLSHQNFGDFPRLCVVGHPASGSEGLTFTASPSIVYYSNDFNGMYRFQSEDRIHRLGMDTNRGATIIDLFHLPTDKYVLDNLTKKKELQSLTLGTIKECLNAGS